MIMLAIKFNKCGIKTMTNIRKNGLHESKHHVAEDFASIFCNKDQVDMPIENTVPTCSNLF